MKRHESDLLSLVFALVFLLVAALWPLWQLGALGSGTINWLPATALVLIGLLGLALSVTRSRSAARTGRPAAAPYDAAPRYEPEHPYDQQQPRAAASGPYTDQHDKATADLYDEPATGSDGDGAADHTAVNTGDHVGTGEPPLSGAR